jgi:hypothetical protein
VFAVFAYVVYFTLLWMLFVSDEPASAIQQKKPASYQTPLDQPHQAPQLNPANSVHPQAALASSRRAAKDLNQLGIRELRELSKGQIRGFMKLNKAELVQALQ